MDSIVLRVSEMKRLVAALARDKIDYVQVSLNEGDTTGRDALPPSAAFMGLRAGARYELIDYDELEAVPVAEADFKVL
jgi:hypothetical protein